VCERLGWQSVAALVNAMNETTRASIANVLAVLVVCCGSTFLLLHQPAK
jgi:hypothetical protein